jgi:hypothetical protein
VEILSHIAIPDSARILAQPQSEGVPQGAGII